MLRAELLKLLTLSASKIAVAVGVAGLIMTQFIALLLLPALASGSIGPGKDVIGDAIPVADLVTSAGQLALLNPLGPSGSSGSLGIVVIAVVLMGVLAGTSDYRFGGIVTTALAQPNRLRILVAKAAAAGMVGFVAGLVFAVVSGATLMVALIIAGNPLAIEPTELIAVVFQSAFAIACLTLVALAVGIFAKSQLTGVLIMVGILISEMMAQSLIQLVAGSLPVLAQLMPLSLAQSVIGTGTADLSPPLAAAALLAWTLAVLSLAACAMRRRDI